MKYIVTYILLFLLVLSLGCNDTGPIKGNLNRSGAARLLNESKRLKETKVLTLHMNPPTSCESITKDDPIREMKSLNLVSYQNKNLTVGQGMFAMGMKNCIVELTEEGKRMSSGWKFTKAINQFDIDKWEIPIAKKSLVEVTGIIGGDKEQAQVEYTWKWVPNELGEKLNNLRPSLELQKGRAAFRKYDDGWRIVEN